MTAKIWIVAFLALVSSAPLVQAQEEWGGGRREFMHRLHEACDDGDDRACWRLEHMRREWREQHDWHGDRHDWQEPRGENRGW